MEQRLSLVTLGVRDLQRAISFYQALGWQVDLLVPGEVAFFQCGGIAVGLWGREQLAQDTGAADAGGWGGITLAHNVRSPAEVDEVLAEVDAAGGTVLRAGAPTDWGGYSGAFADTEGHHWEVAHNPAWPIADDGAVLVRS